MQRIVLLFIGLTLPFKIFAWWEMGHMLVANIAYQHLSVKAKEDIKKLLPIMEQENNPYYQYNYDAKYPNRSMMKIAVWPDHLFSKPNFLFTMFNWHFKDDPISIDGSMPEKIYNQNVVWAIQQLTENLSHPDGNPSIKVRSLAMLIHFVGDIHQPLHNSSLYSKQFPQGDEGGNKYLIFFKEENGDVLNNLHKLWDSGMTLFVGYGFPYNSKDLINVELITAIIMRNQPLNHFNHKDFIFDPEEWHKEGYEIAKNIYNLDFAGEPDASYLARNSLIIEKQLALAGYRLAFLLNKTFSDSQMGLVKPVKV
ncbi:3'-nucleotidase/nuclease [Legionella busanensis]|uniref:3'-nucleotidase/nuclease n=1 Tax=Legionella busanensis TaxID=190655 RepID=A0A378JKZ7_9GAMM|nr:S1/P1 nuclease [Legionella busanensis]STX51411.1 3'-nucleotidase/nuclease [Legionella busanensis]